MAHNVTVSTTSHRLKRSSGAAAMRLVVADVSRQRLLRLIIRDRGSSSADARTHCYMIDRPS